jgi:hypothetical protein
MPNQVDDALLHAMSGSELSRVRTDLDRLRIVPTVAPHPVQPNREFPGHRCLSNVLVSTHRQVHIPTPPVRVTSCRCLRCFPQQIAQQRIALLAEMSQPLPPGTGVFTRNKSRIAADLLAQFGTERERFGIQRRAGGSSARAHRKSGQRWNPRI